MLEITITEKTYPDRGAAKDWGHLALAGLRLNVAPGEFVCLVGPSGCGKSTLLNLVGGLDADYAGDVTLKGQKPSAGIGFMFQTPRLMPWLSVLDNVRLVLPATPEATQRARALLTAMELGDALDAWPTRLSGGMQRRVALARAFAVEPQLLLMDEPFVSLDAPTADRLRDMLVALHAERRCSVLFVTHDLREALALGDRVCFLSAAPGRIVLEHRIPEALVRRFRPTAPEISSHANALLAAHPRLLGGLAHPSPQAVPA